MMHTWKLLAWNGKHYIETASDIICEVRTPKEAIRRFGFAGNKDIEFTYSRKGYGHFTGRIEIRFPETVAAAGKKPLPSDFVLRVIE